MSVQQAGTPGASPAKLPYHSPELTDVGAVADVTWGTGPGFSLDSPSYGGATPPS